MGNYERLLNGEFPPPDPDEEHKQLLARLDNEMEDYLNELSSWIEEIRTNPISEKE